MGENKIVYIAHCKQSMGDTELLITNYSAASDYFHEAKRLYKEAKHKAGEANSTKSLPPARHPDAQRLLPRRRRPGAAGRRASPPLAFGGPPASPARASAPPAARASAARSSVGGGGGAASVALLVRCSRASRAWAARRSRRGVVLAGGGVLAAWSRRWGVRLGVRRGVGGASLWSGSVLCAARVASACAAAVVRAPRLGDIERELGHYDAAERLYEEAFFLYRESNDVLGQANCIKGKGDNKLAQHDPEAARDLFETAGAPCTTRSETSSAKRTAPRDWLTSSASSGITPTPKLL